MTGHGARIAWGKAGKREGNTGAALEDLGRKVALEEPEVGDQSQGLVPSGEQMVSKPSPSVEPHVLPLEGASADTCRPMRPGDGQGGITPTAGVDAEVVAALEAVE